MLWVVPLVNRGLCKPEVSSNHHILLGGIMVWQLFDECARYRYQTGEFLCDSLSLWCEFVPNIHALNQICPMCVRVYKISLAVVSEVNHSKDANRCDFWWMSTLGIIPLSAVFLFLSHSGCPIDGCLVIVHIFLIRMTFGMIILPLTLALGCGD